MFTLRPYQQKSVEAALDFFENGNPRHVPIVVAPTGAGKSVVIAAITKALGTGVLVLQPSKELLEQNYIKFTSYGGVAAIFSASMGVKEVGGVTFATIGSLKGKASLFEHVKYVIIDECHLVPPKEGSMYMNFLVQLPGVKVLGLTATAFRLKKYNDPFTGAPFSQINMLTRERPKFFNHFLHVTQISELYEQNFLAPVKYIELAWSDVGLRVNTTGAEFSEESIEKALLNQEVITRLPGIIKQSVEKGRKHRVVFVNNVLDAEYLATRVPISAAVHAGTHKKERDRILKAFKAGEIKTVFNVGVLTVGFDFPELDTIILARPTMSLTLYLQIVGRGIRTAPGKEDMAFVDMCGNVARFGHIEEITYTTDEKGGALLMNGAKKLSGVKMTK